MQANDAFSVERLRMVEEQIAARGIISPRILDAFRQVPRHLFVPETHRSQAYQDSALPIGFGQTISQPYIVGLMTELLNPQATDKILEIGTGSGYQTAILAALGAKVFSLEIIEALAQRGQAALQQLGLDKQTSIRTGDGYEGWLEQAPFDAIILTCAVPTLPAPVIQQLRPQGKLLAPLGGHLSQQILTLFTKTAKNQLVSQPITGVIFVPLTGPHGFR